MSEARIASYVRLSVLLALTSLLFTAAAFAQGSGVDASFAPVPSRELNSNDVSGKGIAAYPDGKSIIWNGNFVINGLARAHVARLNADGGVDSTFNYCACLLTSVNNAAVLPDGKVLVAGSYVGQAKIVRLNADGTHDPTFASAFVNNGANFSAVSIIRVLQDGRILADQTQSFITGFHARYVTRHLADGSPDPTFTPIGYDGGRLISTMLNSLAVDPSGKIYLALVTSSGASQTPSLLRYNSDGARDTAWETPSFAPAQNSKFLALAAQPDGSLLVGGRFDSVNGTGKVNLVRLAPAGNVDLNFTAPALGGDVSQIAVLQNGKLLVSAVTVGSNQLVRLKADGSLDETFALSATVDTILSRWSLDANERIYFLGTSNLGVYRYFRLNPNGDVDATYNPNVGIFGKLQTVALQPDGRILLAGAFTMMNGVARQSMVRVNADGTLDLSFNAGTGFSSPPSTLVVQPDGKIIATGSFSSYNGSDRQGIVRLNSDGTLDAAFAPIIPNGQTVSTASLQPDGKILIGGNFASVNSTTRTGAARLNADGSLELTFNPVFGSPGITEIFRQADGKIMVGGGFNGVNGFNRSGMVRLNDDGSLDASFNAVGIGTVRRIWLQADGKYFHSGSSGIGRRTSDGTADTSFVSPSVGGVETVVIQPDGTYIIVGDFSTVGGSSRSRIARLTATGSVDQLFFPAGADAVILGAVRQPDGKIVIVGEFTKVENVSRVGAARLTIAPFTAATPFDFDGDGRADFTAYRPSTGVWHELSSSTGTYEAPTFGLPGDIPVPADYDGDGKTDEAIWRPSNGDWWFLSSRNGTQGYLHLGAAGDIPRPGDFDGDGKADFIIYRPSQGSWYRQTGSSGLVFTMSFGAPGDIPLVGDFDGDRKVDPAIFRPSTGDWWYAASSAGNQHRAFHWGATGDIPAPADYDGDGKTDFAIFRPSDGSWYVLFSAAQNYTALRFGLNGDRPIPADYDGDGKADIAVYRPSDGVWYLLQSTAGFGGVRWGVASDVAAPNAFLP